MPHADPKQTVDIDLILDEGAWSLLQKAVVFFAALSITLDGFDNQVLGFATPAILKEWAITRAQIAPVFAIGLLGMTIGTSLAGYVGDKFGRRHALAASIGVFGLATIAIVFCKSVLPLAILRFIAGWGLGGAMPNASAISAEFTPGRHRAFAVTLTVVCVPLGGALAGTTAAWILPAAGWRMLFIIGGGAAVALALAVEMLLPESPRFLARRATQWPELIRLLRRMGKAIPEASAFAAPREKQETGSLSPLELLKQPWRRDTIATWSAFLACLLAVYMVFSWLPTLLSSAGLGLADASSGLAAFNFGGVIGPILLALAIQVKGSRGPMLVAAAGGLVTAGILSVMPVIPGSMALFAALGAHGFFANSLQIALFALAAHIYPTSIRATGIGSAVAVGRLGAFVSVFAGPALIEAGQFKFFQLLAAAIAVSLVSLIFVREHIPSSKE